MEKEYISREEVISKVARCPTLASLYSKIRMGRKLYVSHNCPNTNCTVAADLFNEKGEIDIDMVGASGRNLREIIICPDNLSVDVDENGYYKV